MLVNCAGQFVMLQRRSSYAFASTSEASRSYSLSRAPCGVSYPRRLSSSTQLAAQLQSQNVFIESDDDLFEGVTTSSGVETRLVHWYPGHIARAERQLKEQLTRVDVVMEVRDARIPESTRHPQVSGWIGSKPLLLVMNRVDMVSQRDRQMWQQHLKQQGHKGVIWTNGVTGDGIKQVVAQALQAAVHVKRKRAARGLQQRPIRAVVIGFPNVGKSALINRLVGKRACDSAPKPGVTRQLKWIRLGADLDMLDAPGVLPMSFNDQIAAQRLAICNDIGEASYVDSLVAGALVESLRGLPAANSHLATLQQRYKVPFLKSMTGEDYVLAVADTMFLGCVERAGARLLKDYRTCALGRICLELPTTKR